MANRPLKNPLATSILASALTLLIAIGILLAGLGTTCSGDQSKFLDCVQGETSKNWNNLLQLPRIKLPPIMSPLAEPITSFTNIEVQIQPNGTIILHGQVWQNEKVELFANNRFFGRTVADQAGQWEYIPKPAILNILKEGVKITLKTYSTTRPSTLLNQSVIISTPQDYSPLPEEQNSSPRYAEELFPEPPAEISHVSSSHQLEFSSDQFYQIYDISLPPSELANPAPPVPRITLLRVIKLQEQTQTPYSSGKIIIQDGDTLWSISNRLYGQGNHYTDIFEANKNQISHPHWIFPGQILDVPEEVLPRTLQGDTSPQYPNQASQN